MRKASEVRERIFDTGEHERIQLLRVQPSGDEAHAF